MKGNSVQQTQRFETEQYRRPGIGFKERRGPVLAPPRGLRRLACLFSMMSSLALAQVSGTVPSPGAG